MMKTDSNKLTKEFLQLFDASWNQILKKLSCSQNQLVVGSRLRPQLVLWGYLAGADWSTNLNLQIPARAAVSVELIHKASLLLDDWVDDDNERHGEPAFHAEFGEHVAVMTAMKLVAESINYLLCSNWENDIILVSLQLLVQTATSMADGALAELTLDKKTMFNLDLIRVIAQMETSEIIGNCLQLGFALSEQKNNTLSAYLKKIGDLSGYLFQSLNDLESFSNVVVNKQHKGQENFDVNRNRKNIIIAYMYALLSDKEREEMAEVNMDVIIKLYEKHNIKRLILREIELVFSEIRKLIDSTSQHGAQSEWVKGYQEFIHLLKQEASKRVSMQE